MKALGKWLLETPVRVYAIIIGAPLMTLYAWWVADDLMNTHWSKDSETLRVQILGHSLEIALFIILVIVCALAAVNVRGSFFGNNIDIGGEQPPSRPTVTTTTEIKP